MQAMMSRLIGATIDKRPRRAPAVLWRIGIAYAILLVLESAFHGRVTWPEVALAAGSSACAGVLTLLEKITAPRARS